jgi:hypothetical protein
VLALIALTFAFSGQPATLSQPCAPADSTRCKFIAAILDGRIFPDLTRRPPAGVRIQF